VSQGKAGVLLIQTPEGISFPLHLAGPVTRFLAWVLDTVLVSVLSTAAGVFLSLLRLLSWDLSSAVSILSYFVISIGYPIFAEWYWRGQTIGKRLLKLRVMDAQGLRLQFSQVVVRNLLRFVDMLPALYVVGGAFCLFSKNAQRLGDLAANTIVIRIPEVAEPDVTQILSGKYNSFREYPHLVARLRQRVSLEEAGVVLQSILRREELDPIARLELFSKISGHMRDIVPFPQEATDGLTDEQYVRNVVDVLFRSK